MNIAVNTRLLLPDRLEGIGWFTFEVLKRITNWHKEHKFYFIFDRPYSPEFIFSDNIIPVVVGPQARHPVLFYWWFEKSVPAVLKKYNADLFFSPDGYLSLTTHIKSLPVIHDLNFIHRPEDLPFLIRHYYNYFFPRFAEKASRIITVSEFSKNDISKNFNVPFEKIDVVYNGVNPLFKQQNSDDQTSIKQKYTEGNDYFLYVGSLHKRKNIINLLLAFDRFRNQGDSNHKLLLVGEKLFYQNDIDKTFKKLKNKKDIIFTGRLSSEELAKVMGSAFALVFVPFFEGFGVPLVEAMASGVPVIASDVTSLPEVAGEAVLFADPGSLDAIIDKMNLLIKKPEEYKLLQQKGLKRSESFSWDKTAALTWDSIEKTIKSK